MEEFNIATIVFGLISGAWGIFSAIWLAKQR